MIWGFVVNPWAFLIVLAILLSFEAYSERFWLSLFTIAVFVGAGAILYSTAAIIEHVIAHKIYYIVGAVAYVPCGLIWSLLKYKFFLNREYTHWKDEYNKYEKKKDNPKPWEDYWKDKLDEVGSKAGDIKYWIAYWPFSLICSLFSDMFVAMGRMMYNRFSHLFEKMRASALKKTL